MRIVQLTPGTGTFHCAACIRDNALVKGLRDLGHDALILPLYLPFHVEEEDASADEPILLGGVNMYLQQVSKLFRRTPRWVDRLFDARPLLRLAARRATMTKPESLGEMTLSMLSGESGNQRKEVARLARHLDAIGRPDVVCLSNALLVGLAREIRNALGPVRIVVSLQGEDSFLDSLPEPQRSRAWDLVRERCREVDAFLPVSRTFGDLMTRRLELDPQRVHVVPPGIRAEDHRPAESPPGSPVVGYLARMSEPKGLATLVSAFLHLKKDDRLPGLRLHIAGSVTAADHDLVHGLKEEIRIAGHSEHVDWRPNVTREEKLEFLRGLSALSVPTNYDEDFGLYVIEALASAVPVVQPDRGAFPELIAETGGGTLCAPDDPVDLARALADLLKDPAHARSLGEKGREAVLERFTVRRMAEQVAAVLQEIHRETRPEIGGN